ncbi:MAG TPA: zinc ribbon domain-containing protein [Anaerolineales bacterium]|nr:zinc ribbon domain-containing protein [Anaerolineales bacterium]
MLLIYDFQLAGSAILPVDVAFRIPKEDNLVAVASLSNGQLLNADFSGPTMDDDWQVFQVKVQSPTTYHIEYYAPISRTGKQREFNFVWMSDYPINDFKLSILPPADITQFATAPSLNSVTNSDGSISWEKDFGTVSASQSVTLKINYNRASDALTNPGLQSGVEPSQPIDANTPGRVMLSNYLPYVIVSLGLLLILVGAFYFWQSGRGMGNKWNRQRSLRVETEGSGDVYCHQCGTRALKGDRFCRVCGTKLRRET